jgi:hypothetical protein
MCLGIDLGKLCSFHGVNLNAVLILIRPCATQPKSAGFRCSFFLSAQQDIIILQASFRSLLCFLFDVSGASRCQIQVMLRRDFVSNRVFGLCSLNTLLPFPLVLYLFLLTLRAIRVLRSHFVNLFNKS